MVFRRSKTFHEETFPRVQMMMELKVDLQAKEFWSIGGPDADGIIDHWSCGNFLASFG